MSAGLDVYRVALSDGVRPEPLLTVSAWADRYRFLSSKASAEPGRYRALRTPYMIEIQDQLSPSSSTRVVVLMGGAQIGKTEGGNNWLGYVVHHAPGPMMMVQPTLDIGKRVSKQRIDPMIEATPVLRGRIRAQRSRDSGNTAMSKEFDGGILLITGANSAAGLRSMPIRYLFCDEVDAYPGDVEGEGDPIELAMKRTSTFTRRKVYLASTPTIRGVSRIEKLFLSGDRRRYHIPCPECGHMDWLQWSAGGWRGNEGLHHHIVFDPKAPRVAKMQCSKCEAQVEERHKTWMLEHGQWRGTSISADPKLVSYHLSGLYSPLGWFSWGECAAEFIDAKEDAFILKTWVNTRLAETWEEVGDSIEIDALRSRAADVYHGEVPDGVGALICSVDVQGNRLEVLVKGYGAAEESWLIATMQLPGDPGQEGVWRELDKFLAREWVHASGQKMTIECTVVDSGGLHTEQVYRYVAARQNREKGKVLAIKGGSVPGAPLVARPSTANKYRVRLYNLGVSAGKDMVMARLHIARPGPGHMHFPDWIHDDVEYFAQLTAERAIRKYVKGKGSVREWVKIRDRNEQFDLEVYAVSCLHIMGPVLVRALANNARLLSRRVDAEPEAAAPAPENPRQARQKPPRKGWVENW